MQIFKFNTIYICFGDVSLNRFHLIFIDGAADQMAKQFIHNALPPHLTPKEKARTVVAGGEKWNSSKNRVVNRVELDPDTKIRLIRAHCLRLVTEGFREDSEEPNIRIYYSVENTREYQEIGPQFMEVDSDTAPAIGTFFINFSLIPKNKIAVLVLAF